MLSYATGAERAKAANGDFARIGDKYSYTRNGRIARYFEGITFHDTAPRHARDRTTDEELTARCTIMHIRRLARKRTGCKMRLLRELI